MGGIAGIVCLAQCGESGHTALTEDMCALQAHRGPNGHRVVALGDVSLGANSRRQVTPGDAGFQPLTNDTNTVWIVYDGTLSNVLELSAALSQHGHQFRSTTDAEVVLHAFEEWGTNCLQRLIGIFAFVIYDRRTETFIFVRDRFGVKPLYYMVKNGHLYFASEMKPLIAQTPAPALNKEAVKEWFLYRMVSSPEGLLQGLYAVPPGHLLHLQHGQISSHCYYSPVAEVEATVYAHYAGQSPAAVVAELQAILKRTIQDCLTGEGPVGALCSGGLDSSVMMALAAQQRDVMAVHVFVRDAPWLDELRYAEETARFLRVPLVSCAMDCATFLTTLPRVVFLNEWPLTHIQTVAFFLGMQLAKEHGIQALLVGDAADTVLGGNWTRQQVLLALQRMAAHLPKRLRTALGDTFSVHTGIPVRPFFNPDGIEVIDRFTRQGIRLACEAAYQFVTNAIDRTILATKLAHLCEDVSWYLQRGDRLGMAAAVEYRVPFLDYRLIKMAINQPWHYQMRGCTEKWALKKVAAPFLPRHIVYRKKVPWDLPLQAYLAPLARLDFFKGGACLDMLSLDQKAIAAIVETYERYLPSFYNLVNLEIWGRLFLLGQTVEQVTEQVMRLS